MLGKRKVVTRPIQKIAYKTKVLGLTTSRRRVLQYNLGRFSLEDIDFRKWIITASIVSLEPRDNCCPRLVKLRCSYIIFPEMPQYLPLHCRKAMAHHIAAKILDDPVFGSTEAFHEPHAHVLSLPVIAFSALRIDARVSTASPTAFSDK